MKTKKQTVRLRKKTLKNGEQSLYLDIYWNGKRSKEFLRLYLVKPQNQIDRENNKQTLELAEKIRAKRQIELANNQWGFTTNFKLDINFIEYFQSLSKKKNNSMGTFYTWTSTLKHLIDFAGTNITFKDIDDKFVKGFKEYLENKARTINNLPLSKNTQNAYLKKLKAALNQAFEERIILDNPAKRLKGIKYSETKREYLTFEELKKLAKTDCKDPELKNAFLFSCLTGLRWSDIQKLQWSEVQKHGNDYRIVFKQKKTGTLEYLDISKQAVKFLGERGNPDERVFKGLKYSKLVSVKLQRWLKTAGISKRITFHCARHTFAILQLEFGTDFYTVSKLLGHKELQTTQIYAKIVDEKIKKAMNKIPNLND